VRDMEGLAVATVQKVSDHLPSLLFVTGTDTDVGKTVVSAALACYLDRSGPVFVTKPLQTGVGPGEPGDAAEIRRLSGLSEAAVHEGVRLRDPLAPTTAARREGIQLPTVEQLAVDIATQFQRPGSLIVEGAGGLLVGLDGEGRNLADIAGQLRPDDLGFVVVVRSGLGTLNHTLLTVEGVRARNLPIAGLVIGSWPKEPDLADRCNLAELPELTGVPVIGRIPAGAAALEPADFRAAAAGWFGPSWRDLDPEEAL
jgi:dethiobiotin synthetase